PTPIPTALEGPVAQEGETLLLIADFTYIDADATRVEANLENEFEDATVRFVRIHHPIEDRAQAKAILAQYNATIILWGSVARGGVRVEFEISQNLDDQATISLLSSGQLEVAASDVRSFDGYIFEALDTRYIVETMLGRLAYYEGDYQAALAAFGRAKQRVPADRAADVRAEYLYMFQGRAYEAEGEFDAALTAYNDALTMDSTWGMPYYFISFIYAKQKNFTQAYTASDEAIRLGFDGHGMFADDTTFFESSAYLLRGLSNLLMASTISGVPTSAVIADLDRALELLDGLGDPSLVADAYVARGVAHLFAGDVVSAVTDFDTALVLDPNRAYLHAQQASALMVTDDNDGALQSINRAIELDTTTASYYQLRGDILVQLGQFEAALAAYDRALEIAPSDYLSFAGRGTVYTQLGDYAAAIDAYNQALTLAPQVTSLYMQRGSVYFEMEDYANAAADYTTALESDSIEMATALADPKLRSGGYALRGQAYLQLGQYNACRDDLTVSIEAVPDANVYALRARCAMFMNDGSSAEADFNAAFELNPNQANIFSGRVYLYTQVPGYENCTLADAAYLVYVELIGPSEPFSSWVTTTCNRATPSPTPPTVTDALFPDGTIITLPGPRPVSLLTEPLTGNPSIFCTPSTEATVLQTVQLANGTRWVQLECDGGIGWMDESKLPIP
ncbi:MAG: tetratricopeptide repeat protein, partial [Anaerolineae bacterium]|nr:tetratricopeptide repeat protein [Anaerolineae bacterium]